MFWNIPHLSKTFNKYQTLLEASGIFYRVSVRTLDISRNNLKLLQIYLK